MALDFERGFLDAVRAQNEMLRAQSLEVGESLATPPWASAQVYGRADAARIALLPPPPKPRVLDSAASAREVDAAADPPMRRRTPEPQRRPPPVAGPAMRMPRPCGADAARTASCGSEPPRADALAAQPHAAPIAGGLHGGRVCGANEEAAALCDARAELLARAAARMGALGLGAGAASERAERRPLSARARPALAAQRRRPMSARGPASTLAAASAALQVERSGAVGALRALDASLATELALAGERAEPGAALRAQGEQRMFARLVSQAGAGPARPPELPPRGLCAVALSRLGGFVCRAALEEPCCICIERILPGQSACALQCAHTFHMQCITLWLRRQAACPLCKRDPSDPDGA